jgi:hypothetical protein
VSEHAGTTRGATAEGLNPLTLPGSQGPTSTATSADAAPSLSPSDFGAPESLPGSTLALGEEEQESAKPVHASITPRPRAPADRSFPRLVDVVKEDLAFHEKKEVHFYLSRSRPNGAEEPPSPRSR